MEKNEIIFEYDVDFASLVMDELPIGNIDKTNAGCGMTSVAIENSLDTVILMPSLNLINNKYQQYPNERCNYKLLKVFGGVGEDEIEGYVEEVTAAKSPIKILCSYDGAWKIEPYLKRCRFVIDESQNILQQHHLKASGKKEITDNNILVKLLQLIEKHKETTSLISAHPAPLEYMPKEIQDLPQVKIKWKNTLRVKPILLNHHYTNQALKDTIINPLLINGKINVGNTEIATKVIVFMNSVNSIIKTITDCSIHNESQVIISDNYSNDMKLKKAGNIQRLKDPRNLPQFTFITKTGFAGIDLYDDDAVNVIVSSTGKEFTLVDMTLDLEQAISRNRNMPTNRFFFIYNAKEFEKDEAEMLFLIKENRRKIENNIRLYHIAIKEGLEEDFMSHTNFRTYTYFNNNGTLVFNEPLFKVDEYKIRNVIARFRKGFDVAGLFSDVTIIDKPITARPIGYIDAVEFYNKHGFIETETPYLKKYSELLNQFVLMYPSKNLPKDEKYARHLINIYDYELNIKIDELIFENFLPDVSYTKKNIKETIQTIFKSVGFDGAATSETIREWFDVKQERKGKKGSKRSISYKLLSKKEPELFYYK